MSNHKPQTLVERLKHQRTRELLANSRNARQRAVAEFPLKVFEAAQELRGLCEMRDQGLIWSREANKVMQRLEDDIRDCYRDTFGTELGQ